MLKRYIILAVAFSFMAISIPKCPFSVIKSSGGHQLTQTPAAVKSVAAAPSTGKF
jgi:hypothetical protein